MKDLNIRRHKEKLIKIALERHDTYSAAAEALGITTRALLFIRERMQEEQNAREDARKS